MIATTNPEESDNQDARDEETARAKLEEVKRYAWSLICKLMTPDEIRVKLRKLETKGHSQFE
jgi:hypothetical protein